MYEIPATYGNLFQRHRGQLEATAKAVKQGMGCRTGKTAGAMDKVAQTKGFPLLIVAPLSVLVTWESFLLDEGFLPEQIVTVRSKSSQKASLAKNKLLSNAPIFLVNYESIQLSDSLYFRSKWQSEDAIWDSATWKVSLPDRAPEWLDMKDWKTVIVDECYRIANYESSVTKYFLERPWRNDVNWLLLSAAPASESPMQFAPGFILMYGTYFGCKTAEEYVLKFWYKDEITMKYRVKSPSHLQEIKDFVQEKAYCLTMQELGLGCVPLFSKRYIDTNDEQKRLLGWLNDCEEYESILTGETVPMSGGVRAMFNLKIAAGLNPLTDEIVSDDMFRDTYEYFRDNQEPLLVISAFVNPIIAGAYYLEQKGLRVGTVWGDTPVEEREATRVSFQNGELDIVIAQPVTIQMGQDYSNLGDMIMWSNSTSGQVRLQVTERGQRVDRGEPYQIIDMCPRGTKAEKLSNLLTRKGKESIFYLETDKDDLLNELAEDY